MSQVLTVCHFARATGLGLGVDVWGGGGGGGERGGCSRVGLAGQTLLVTRLRCAAGECPACSLPLSRPLCLVLPLFWPS